MTDALTTRVQDSITYNSNSLTIIENIYKKYKIEAVLNSLLVFPPQVTVLTSRKVDGGTICVPTPIWMACGIEAGTIAAAIRTGSTGQSSMEAPILSSGWPWWSNLRDGKDRPIWNQMCLNVVVIFSISFVLCFCFFKLRSEHFSIRVQITIINYLTFVNVVIIMS